MEKGEIKMKAIPDDVWEKMQSDIAEIKVALLGNEYNPYGALHQIKEHERCIADLQNKINKMMWWAAGAGTVAGFLINIAFKLLFLE